MVQGFKPTVSGQVGIVLSLNTNSGPYLQLYRDVVCSCYENKNIRNHLDLFGLHRDRILL